MRCLGVRRGGGRLSIRGGVGGGGGAGGWGCPRGGGGRGAGGRRAPAPPAGGAQENEDSSIDDEHEGVQEPQEEEEDGVWARARKLRGKHSCLQPRCLWRALGRVMGGNRLGRERWRVGWTGARLAEQLFPPPGTKRRRVSGVEGL